MIHAEIIIRQAVTTDAAELLELIRTAMDVYTRNAGISSILDSQRETLDDFLAHLRADHVLIAEHRGRLIGTVRLIHGEDDSAYFSRFAVLPSLQMSGVGKQLYQAAEEWLRAQGVRTVYLHTALTNLPLVDFYEARGFQLLEIKTTQGYPRGLFRKLLL